MITIILIILGLIFVIGNSDKYNNQGELLKVFIFVILWLIIGLRYKVGIDYTTYEITYDHPKNGHNLTIEPLWQYINGFLHLMGFKSRIYFLVTSGFTMLCFYKAIKELSPAFYLSTLIFVLMGFYFESANAIRQFCAMGAVFWGYAFLQKKEWWQAIILLVLAFNLHYSSLFGIVLIGIAYIRVNKVFLFILMTICALFGSEVMNFVLSKVMPVMSDINVYTYEIDQYSDGVSSGLLKYFYYLLGVMLIVTSKGYDKDDNADVYKLLNLTIYGICIYSIFYTFMPARRLYMYGFMFFIILFPYALRSFDSKVRLIISTIICIAFAAFLIKSNLELPYNFDIKII